MSKGSKIIPVRVEPELLATILKELALRNERTRGEQHSLSQWIRDAIEKKLDHVRRGRTARRRKAKGHGIVECSFCPHGVVHGDYCYACDMLNYQLDQQ